MYDVPEILSRHAASIVDRLSSALALPVAISDQSGRVIARSGPESAFCPLLARDGANALPLPEECDGCPRIGPCTHGGEPQKAPCPYGIDAVWPIKVGGVTAGWLSTAVVERGMASAVRHASDRMETVATVLGAALAAEARERQVRETHECRIDSAIREATEPKP